MPDLHGWITQQIDDREEAARAAADGDSGEWFVGEKWNVLRIESLPAGCTPNILVVYGNMAVQSDHIALNDPASVLRRCAADRKILAAHPYTTRVINPVDGSTSAGFGCETCHDLDGVPEGRGNCATILAVAEAYELTPEIPGYVPTTNPEA